VRFDLDADGIPEQVAWTRPDSEDAFLALDRNGNGLIDDGTELFDNHTPARPDLPGITTANGFEALKRGRLRIFRRPMRATGAGSRHRGSRRRFAA
jgi:hypothetical protein